MKTVVVWNWLALVLLTTIVCSLIFIVGVRQFKLPQRDLFSSSAQFASTCGDKDFQSWHNGVVTKLMPHVRKDCGLVCEGNKSEVDRLNALKVNWTNSFSDEELLGATMNCSWVLNYFYNNLYVTRLERSFPVAFTFLVYNNPQQVVRLLRLLYRQHNQYYVHTDSTSSPEFKATFVNIAGCLPNIHVPLDPLNVNWGHSSIMEAAMKSYKELTAVRRTQADSEKWKYVINLCGKELPIATNHEIVSHLVKLDGQSMVEARRVSRRNWLYNHRLKEKFIPHGSIFHSSSFYMCLSFQFVNHLLTDTIAISLFKIFKTHCVMPEEHYFATVFVRPNVPGGRNQNLTKDAQFQTVNYFWNLTPEQKKACQGKEIHHICVVEIGDTQRVLNATGASGERALFQNKYFMENDHLIMDCMEERIVARNKLECEQDCTTHSLYLLPH